MKQNYQLKVGDVVLVVKGGWGFVDEDVDKYVEVIGFGDYFDEDGVGVKPYNCELITANGRGDLGDGGFVGYGSFGTNPTVLLNVHDNVDSPAHTKIEVLTAEFNYQGLYKGTVIDNAKVTPNGVEFKHNGKNWVLSEEDYLVFKGEVKEAIKSDAVNHPKHYAVFEQLEAIEVIASSMTLEQFYGYCLGNILKYRLRVGGKDDVMQELGKVSKYQELFTIHKHLCKDFK